MWANWHPLRHSSDEVALGCMLHPQPGYPFTLELEVGYRLTADGLEVTLRATNRGAATGALRRRLPSLPRRSAARRSPTRMLELPAGTRVPVDERLLPTGAPGARRGHRATTSAASAPLGPLALDTCFGDIERGADGLARATLVAGGGGR